MDYIFLDSFFSQIGTIIGIGILFILGNVLFGYLLWGIMSIVGKAFNKGHEWIVVVLLILLFAIMIFATFKECGNFFIPEMEYRHT